MKKIYTAPLTEVVKVNAEQIICTSTMGVGDEYNSSTTTILSKDDEDFDSSEDLW